MKNIIFLSFMLVGVSSFAQEYKIITVVESIIPAGLGRSRMIEATETKDYKALTTERVDGE